MTKQLCRALETASPNPAVTTPRTDQARVEAGRLGGILMESDRERFYLEFARQLERELRLAQCPLHDCCGGKGRCPYYGP
jgi:hypothetical protein